VNRCALGGTEQRVTDRVSRIASAAAVGAWGSAVVAFALWLRIATPERGRPWLATIMASEPFHIAAHLMLYGVLTAFAWRATRRLWASALAVTVFAVVQEAAQSVWWGRAFERGEYFDLAVDAVAAAIVLAACNRAIKPDRGLRPIEE
jgi:hypothetical protein